MLYAFWANFLLLTALACSGVLVCLNEGGDNIKYISERLATTRRTSLTSSEMYLQLYPILCPGLQL